MSEAEAHDPHRLSRQTTPTWEVELLISGVALFAMLQLPGWLDERMFALEPRLGAEWRMVLMLFYFYSKSAAVVLAVTFALHLLLRAQWIALVGVHSVYPQGIRLERMRMGPIQRAIEAGAHDSAADAIERADNRASVAFAIGVSVALMIVFVCVSFCGALLLVTALSLAVGWRVEPLEVMFGVFAAVMLPFIAATSLDHAFDGRLDPCGRPHRLLAALLRFYARIGMGRRNNRIIATLSSNGGERRMMALVIGSMVAAILGTVGSYAAMRGAGALGSYARFPGGASVAIDAAHYGDRRDPARDGAVPYVQSLVADGPYLELVVPYRPRLLEPAMRERCAHAERLQGRAREAARLACLQALHAVALDGRPLPGLRYEVASDPRTDRPALLAMIDVRDLARGRHELRVARPLRADREPDPDDPHPGHDAIPFWR